MKKTLIHSAILLLICASVAGAEEKVLASVPPEALVPGDYLSQTVVPLTDTERKALQLSSQWSRSDIQPYLAGGKLVYVHGAGTVPTILASPMQVCDVELEPGEAVNEIVVGDSARWMVESGTAGNATHLFIKPGDAGLQSSAVITTNRRVYHLRLVSQSTGHTPYVGFVYNDALRHTALQKKEKEEKDKQWQSTTDTAGKDVDLAKLNFNYDVAGSASWKPERVYDDGQKTYIKLPRVTKSGELPVLLVRKGSKDVLVNYRVPDPSTMMVDGIFDTIALIVGVGSDQESVEIRRSK